MAEALGVKFRRSDSHSESGAPGAQVTDPRAIMAELGQSELVPYVPPQRGLIIDPGGKA